ncbi:hypothetical protein DPMN_183680 [Dreissena polymorpha]|uniref:Uncharacterized protein n=1 Tax=Dreissena polymorpha TaxID=45954 RepID=A0A9D4DH27_DREPO|nr:hypothetical protein DPMN_183680 [Dreissena polymorpha]
MGLILNCSCDGKIFNFGWYCFVVEGEPENPDEPPPVRYGYHQQNSHAFGNENCILTL